MGQLKAKKQNLLFDVRRQMLTEREADDLRAFVATLKPHVYLIKSAWPWVEVRGLTEVAAQRFRERLRGITAVKITSSSPSKKLYDQHPYRI